MKQTELHFDPNDNSIGYAPAPGKRVWVAHATTEEGQRYVIHASYTDEEQRVFVTLSKRAWEDLFEALHETWRIALVVRDIQSSERFIEVCKEVLGMVQQHRAVLHLPTNLRRALQRGGGRDA